MAISRGSELNNFTVPFLTGLQVVAELRRHMREEFVIGVTGNALKEDQEEFESAGADHVLTKPVQAASLAQMLELARSKRDRSAPATRMATAGALTM